MAATTPSTVMPPPTYNKKPAISERAFNAKKMKITKNLFIAKQ